MWYFAKHISVSLVSFMIPCILVYASENVMLGRGSQPPRLSKGSVAQTVKDPDGRDVSCRDPSQVTG